MDKLEYRAVIKFLVLEGCTPIEIQARMIKVYGKSMSPSSSTIKKWAAEFKKGRISIKDDPREGRPKCATTSDVVQKVSNLIAKDQRLKVREIADVLDVSTGSAFEILTKKLSMRKLFGRWVPTDITYEERENRKKAAETCLEVFNKKKPNLIDNLITLGEIWIHVYEQLTKTDAPPPKMKKASTSSGKILAFIFWDADGILFSSYVQKNEVVNAAYIRNLLGNLNIAVCQKRPNRLNEVIYFYPDMFDVYDDSPVLDKLNEISYVLLKQPRHSPDLSPSGYHIFPKLENFLQAKRPTSAEEAIKAVEHYFHDLPQNNFRIGIELLEKRCMDCISLDGNYVESYLAGKSDFVETE